MNQTFRVWDPERECSVASVEAVSPEQAAEQYAEDDSDGQADHLYDAELGHLLYVRDAAHEQWEVRVAIETMPLAAALKSVRV